MSNENVPGARTFIIPQNYELATLKSKAVCTFVSHLILLHVLQHRHVCFHTRFHRSRHSVPTYIPESSGSARHFSRAILLKSVERPHSPCGSWLLRGGCLLEHSVRGAGPAAARGRPQALQHAHRAQLAPVYPFGPFARCPFDVLILAAALLREVRLAARVARASRGVTPFGAGAITLRLVHVGLRRPGLGLLGLSLLRLLQSREGDLASEVGHFVVEACATRAMPSARVIGAPRGACGWGRAGGGGVAAPTLAWTNGIGWRR